MSPGQRLARFAAAHVRKLHAASTKAGVHVATFPAGVAESCQLSSSSWPSQASLIPLLSMSSSLSSAGSLGLQWTLAQRNFTSTGVQAAAADANKASEDAARRDSELQQSEDPFDTITDRIPEKPVSVAEGASYTVVIVAFLGLAAAAMFYVAKELLFEPKEYKVFNKALDRVKDDSQVAVRIGRPITGYGSESRNRAARQRIRHQITKDEDGTDRITVRHSETPSKRASGDKSSHRPSSSCTGFAVAAN